MLSIVQYMEENSKNMRMVLDQKTRNGGYQIAVRSIDGGSVKTATEIGDLSVIFNYNKDELDISTTPHFAEETLINSDTRKIDLSDLINKKNIEAGGKGTFVIHVRAKDDNREFFEDFDQRVQIQLEDTGSIRDSIAIPTRI